MLARRFVAPVMKRVVRSAAMPKFAPRFSTLLDKKEGAEEARYIRDIENRRKEEIRANVERILAMEDSHEEKQELVELLGKRFFNKFRPNILTNSIIYCSNRRQKRGRARINCSVWLGWLAICIACGYDGRHPCRCQWGLPSDANVLPNLLLYIYLQFRF